jgi:hypothetical protein
LLAGRFSGDLTGFQSTGLIPVAVPVEIPMVAGECPAACAIHMLYAGSRDGYEHQEDQE